MLVIKKNNQKAFAANEITNKNDLHQIEFFIPKNSKRETLIVTITAENNDSELSEILQIFKLGKQSDDGKSSIP